MSTGLTISRVVGDFYQGFLGFGIVLLLANFLPMRFLYRGVAGLVPQIVFLLVKEHQRTLYGKNGTRRYLRHGSNLLDSNWDDREKK